MSLLLEYFGEEDGAERKAATLAVVLANRLSRMGREWKLTENQLNARVCELLVSAAETIRGVNAGMVVEEVWGERRDLRREMVRCEAIRARLVN